MFLLKWLLLGFLSSLAILFAAGPAGAEPPAAPSTGARP
jgi:hypothetical protein